MNTSLAAFVKQQQSSLPRQRTPLDDDEATLRRRASKGRRIRRAPRQN